MRQALSPLVVSKHYHCSDNLHNTLSISNFHLFAMRPIRLGSAMLLAICSLWSTSASASTGEFEITGMEIDSPFQADPKSISNSTVSFIFNDLNTPKSWPASCYLTWAVGLNPPSRYARGACSDIGVNAWFPKGTYKGVADFQVEISHTYQDDSIGLPPYNIRTLYGLLNLTYVEAEETSGYKCDMARASCHSEPDTILIAKILRAAA